MPDTLTMASPITRYSIPRPGWIIKYDIILNRYVEVDPSDETFETYNAHKRAQQLRRQEEEELAHEMMLRKWRAERQQQRKLSGRDLPDIRGVVHALSMEILGVRPSAEPFDKSRW